MLLSLFLTAVLIAFVAFPTFIILACGLAPAAAAGIFDNRRGRSAFACVLAANLCGVVVPLIDLWMRGNTLPVAIGLLSDVYVWLMMYGAAAMGWVLLWAGPMVMEVVLVFTDDGRVRRMRAYQRNLIAEWGESVTGKVED